MEDEKLNVEFVDVPDARKCCLVNGRTLIDPELLPDEKYFNEVKSFIENIPVLNITKIAGAILTRNLKGLNLAMFAFSAGRVVAMESDELCMRSLKVLMSKGSVSVTCRDGYKVAKEQLKDEMLASVVALITFGIFSHVVPNAKQIMMASILGKMMGGINE